MLKAHYCFFVFNEWDDATSDDVVVKAL